MVTAILTNSSPCWPVCDRSKTTLPMKNKTLLFAVAVMATVAGIWFGQSILSSRTGPAARPDFNLPDMHGKMHSLATWQDKVIVLNFWATWCPPCREEIPAFIELQKRHGDSGIQVIGIAVDNLREVVAYYAGAGMNYPVLIGEDGAMSVMTDFGNTTGSLPYSVILNRQGEIIARKLGVMTLVELEGIVRPHLRTQRP